MSSPEPTINIHTTVRNRTAQLILWAVLLLLWAYGNTWLLELSVHGFHQIVIPWFSHEFLDHEFLSELVAPLVVFAFGIFTLMTFKLGEWISTRFGIVKRTSSLWIRIAQTYHFRATALATSTRYEGHHQKIPVTLDIAAHKSAVVTVHLENHFPSFLVANHSCPSDWPRVALGDKAFDSAFIVYSSPEQTEHLHLFSTPTRRALLELNTLVSGTVKVTPQTITCVCNNLGGLASKDPQLPHKVKNILDAAVQVARTLAENAQQHEHHAVETTEVHRVQTV